MEKPKSSKKFFSDAVFVKASGSRCAEGGGGSGQGGSTGGICVEVAKKNGFVGVRDSKNPNGPVLAYTTQEWEVFVAGVKNGEFD